MVPDRTPNISSTDCLPDGATWIGSQMGNTRLGSADCYPYGGQSDEVQDGGAPYWLLDGTLYIGSQMGHPRLVPRGGALYWLPDWLPYWIQDGAPQNSSQMGHPRLAHGWGIPGGALQIGSQSGQTRWAPRWGSPRLVPRWWLPRLVKK